MENDAKTMDDILADEFVLVTGKGKVFTKKDLLDEARSGSVVYQPHDDSMQAVRSWGCSSYHSKVVVQGHRERRIA